ncbi:unnamed protein product, partial [Onchocerca ochengi]
GWMDDEMNFEEGGKGRWAYVGLLRDVCHACHVWKEVSATCLPCPSFATY